MKCLVISSLACPMWQVKCCLSNDGYIAREEMMALLQNCLNLSGQEEEGEDGIKVLKVPECLYSVLSRTWLTWHWRRWTLIKMAGSATKTLRQRLVITSSHSLASFRFRSGSTFNFSMKIEKEPLLLEAFGPCLPRAEALHKFFQQVLHLRIRVKLSNQVAPGYPLGHPGWPSSVFTS